MCFCQHFGEKFWRHLPLCLALSRVATAHRILHLLWHRSNQTIEETVNIYGVLELGSILLNIIIYFHIKLYQKKNDKSVTSPVLPTSYRRKLLFLKEIKSETLSSILTNCLNILIMALTAFNQSLVNKINSDNLNLFPYTLFVHYIFLIAPNFLVGLSLIVYYFHHSPLRKTIFGQAKLGLQWLAWP